MRRFSKPGGDSLDLLLDTMCNTFGGIILIAVLVALLTQTTQSNRAPTTRDVETSEMLERRIAQAEADLADVRQLQVTSQAMEAGPAASLIQQKDRAREALARARSESDAAGSAVDQLVSAKSVDAGKEIVTMNATEAEARRKQTELQNALAAQEQNSARLRARLEQLAKGIAEAKSERVEKLRFPKERSATKQSFPVIFRHNRAYPLYDENLDRNRDSIRWEANARSDGQFAHPIEARGLSSEAAQRQLSRMAQSVGTEKFYCAFYVYPDSVEVFKATQEKAVALGFDFGWEPVEPSETLSFGSEGSSPPPL